MIIIADSGATKTRWQVCDSNQPQGQPLHTSGYNPYHWTREGMAESMAASLPSIEPSEVYFYGAGCSTSAMKSIVEFALHSVFPRTKIHVYHDLMGAARSLAGHKSGIACILGTGSNSCVYDGQEITDNIPSLGYILGDEGSGFHLGKTLVSDILTRRAPDDISSAFFKETGLQLDTILENIYKKPLPGKFLAGFTYFISDKRDNTYIKNLIRQCFRQFLESRVLPYPESESFPLGVTGSVGAVFAAEFRETASAYNLQVSKIVADPLPGLVSYHLTGIQG